MKSIKFLFAFGVLFCVLFVRFTIYISMGCYVNVCAWFYINSGNIHFDSQETLVYTNQNPKSSNMRIYMEEEKKKQKQKSIPLSFLYINENFIVKYSTMPQHSITIRCSSGCKTIAQMYKFLPSNDGMSEFGTNNKTIHNR